MEKRLMTKGIKDSTVIIGRLSYGSFGYSKGSFGYDGKHEYGRLSYGAPI